MFHSLKANYTKIKQYDVLSQNNKKCGSTSKHADKKGNVFTNLEW